MHWKTPKTSNTQISSKNTDENSSLNYLSVKSLVFKILVKKILFLKVQGSALRQENGFNFS